MNEKKNVLLHRVVRKIFEEATAASLGGTFNVIISFHLKQKFGKDPYEVLIDNPRTFNDGLKEVLGRCGSCHQPSRHIPHHKIRRRLHSRGIYRSVHQGQHIVNTEAVRDIRKHNHPRRTETEAMTMQNPHLQ